MALKQVTNVVHLRHPRPQVFTVHEEFIDSVRVAIFTSHIPTRKLAEEAGVSPGTVERIARGDTKWPRHTTLFPLLAALNKRLAMVDA